ncbi:MAG: PaaI family thioesterase [Rikenellaceae bacterium]|jgi:acyl-coenzyme A thioesterase PaaI-like protein|nr:PaaI family thioesterase [Rikenellaceae bacterium]
MKYKVKRAQFNSKNCFICGKMNEMGLRARFYETTDNELISISLPRAKHQSYPMTLHGGVSAAILDETIGRAICAFYGDMVWGVTMELHVKYRKPVPYDGELIAIGRITADRGRIFEGEGELYLPNGEVAVEARGTYMKRQVDQLGGAGFVDEEWGFTPDEATPEWIEIG